jgi:hypothetical protein
MALYSEPACTCCAMPDDNLIDLNSQKKLIYAYKVCTGIELPPDNNQVRKICLVCREQLESALKFHEYCQKPNKNLLSCCLCDSPSKSKPLKNISFLHNHQVINCFDVFRKYSPLNSDASDYQMCVACVILLEEWYVFRDICLCAIKIMENRRQYSQLQGAKSIVKLELTLSSTVVEAPADVKLEIQQPNIKPLKKPATNDLYCCAICAATFKSRYNILCHMKKQHLSKP